MAACPATHTGTARPAHHRVSPPGPARPCRRPWPQGPDEARARPGHRFLPPRPAEAAGEALSCPRVHVSWINPPTIATCPWVANWAARLLLVIARLGGA